MPKAKKKEYTQDEIDAAFIANGGIPKPRKKEANPVGRPTDYHKIDLEQIKKYANAGLSNGQIAELCGIALSTLYLYQQDYPEFSDALKGNKNLSDDRVERGLFERAVGYVAPEEKVFYDPNLGTTVSKTILKHYPPDTAAAFIWLQNRRPKEWKNRQTIENETPTDLTKSLETIANAIINRDG